MDNDEPEIVLSGAVLKTVVRMAETPGVGLGVKKRLFSQLGIDALFDIDLREHGDPEPMLQVGTYESDGSDDAHE